MASCFPVVEAHLESVETNGPAGEQHITTQIPNPGASCRTFNLSSIVNAPSLCIPMSTFEWLPGKWLAGRLLPRRSAKGAF